MDPGNYNLIGVNLVTMGVEVVTSESGRVEKEKVRLGDIGES